jgi:hypothetical protein
MDLNYQSFSDQLRVAVPGFAGIFDEHVADNGEVLPHVLLGDLVRFLSNEIQVHGVETGAVQQAMALLECGMASDDARLQELVAVSFLENLEPEDPSFPTIRKMFGPRLEEQYTLLTGEPDLR